jgi:hypothetical protein
LILINGIWYIITSRPKSIMPVKISPINPEDIPGAARCIQRAFSGDPYFRWVFDVASVGIPILLSVKASTPEENV